MKKPLYVVDFDDVLVNMSWKWAMLAYKNICTPSEICDILINSKKKWLYDKFNQPENNIMDYYLNQKGFYDDLPPTKFCERLKKISGKNDIFVISYIMEEHNGIEKEKWLKKHLPTAKFQFLYYDSKWKKSDVINQMELNYYTAFSDDRISNIVDVMENTDSVEKMFYIPKYGCNTIEMIRNKLKNKSLIEERKIFPFYYSDFFVENHSILDMVDWKQWK